MDNTLNDGKMYCDRRLGGVERWYIGKPKDAHMRIPDDQLESVCFLCVKVQDEAGEETDFFIGTGFFVSVASRIPGKTFLYLITARHVIDGAREQGYTDFYVRLNTANGRAVTASLNAPWYFHENPAVDAAVIPVLIPAESGIKIRFTPVNALLTDEAASEHGVGIGDELFIIGLFNHRSGNQRNIPVLRTGVISAMPVEPFEDEHGDEYDAYLVETRSIGGLSGSPVYVYLDMWRIRPQGVNFDLTALRWNIFMLGIVRGHWELKRRDAAPDSYINKAENAEIDRLNTGIAQVTPIQDVLAILNGETLVKLRKDAEEREIKKRQPTLDTNLPPERGAAEGALTSEGFEEALKRASRKVSQPESETKETSE